MSLREDMWKYEQITGESAEHVPIIKLGAFLDGYDMAIKALEQTRWIPVSERLPEKSGEYWCTFRGTNLTGSDYYTTEADAKKLFDEPEEYIGWRSQNVIAWMPLPEPYKAESEE